MNAKLSRPTNLRDEYAAQTRERILSTLVKILQAKNVSDVSYAELATEARVAERTVYRHFPDKAELMIAAANWIDEHVFPFDESEKFEDTPTIVREIFERYDRWPNLAQLLAISRIGSPEVCDARKHVAANVKDGLKPFVEGLSEEEVLRTEAVVSYINSIMMWSTIRKEYGLSADKVADAHNWLFSLVLDDLKRRRDEK